MQEGRSRGAGGEWGGAAMISQFWSLCRACPSMDIDKVGHSSRPPCTLYCSRPSHNTTLLSSCPPFLLSSSLIVMSWSWSLPYSLAHPWSRSWSCPWSSNQPSHLTILQLKMARLVVSKYVDYTFLLIKGVYLEMP